MYDLRLSVASISWRTLIKFLQFTLEQSNWTTGIHPPHLPPLTFEEKLEQCYMRISGDSAPATRPARGVLLENDRIGQNAMVPLHQLFNQEQREATQAQTLALTLGDLSLALQMQEEEAEVAAAEAGPLSRAAARHRVGIWVDSDEEEDPSPASSWRGIQDTVDPEQGTVSQSLAEVDATLKKEKTQLVEILGILGEKAEKSELEEGAYKEYADLLMKFHKILGEERQRVVNV
jgi:hypothetical protein